jgi:hypothetical protein
MREPSKKWLPGLAVMTVTMMLFATNGYAAVNSRVEPANSQANVKNKPCEPYGKVYRGRLLVNPKSVKQGVSIKALGSGFKPNTNVRVSLPGNTTMNVTVNKYGGISFKYVIPKTLANGIYSISAEGTIVGKRGGTLVLSATVHVKSKKQNKH